MSTSAAAVKDAKAGKPGKAKGERPRSNSQVNTGGLEKGGKKGAKRDEGTPEQQPSSIASDPELKRVIINEEILALQITQDDLLRLREPKPPDAPPTYAMVTVRKIRSPPCVPTKRVAVAVPQPMDAALYPRDYASVAGARFDCDGNIVPYSILGGVDEFRTQAVCRGELPPDYGQPCRPPSGSGQLSVKYAKRPADPVSDESNALLRWEQHMALRRRQQEYLSCVVGKRVEALAMHQGDAVRKTNELRALIDRTLPYIEAGKGDRVGSEFWTQQRLIGGEERGIHATLARRERGCPLPIQHTGVPNIVLCCDKGMSFDNPALSVHKPWHKSEYLRDRLYQLAPLMDQLDPHDPDTAQLEVVGRAAPSHCSPGQPPQVENFRDADQGEESANEPLPEDAERKEGSSSPHSPEGGSASPVTGPSVVLSGQMKFPESNRFNVSHHRIQRFYFNPASGILLPGEETKFPIFFRSPTVGVYTERWGLQTHPAVSAGGTPFPVTLRGVVVQPDCFEAQRRGIEHTLEQAQICQIVAHSLQCVLSRVHPRPRPRSPINAYITEAQLFRAHNPQLEYSEESSRELRALYCQSFTDQNCTPPEWNLAVPTIHEGLMSVVQDDVLLDGQLQKLTNLVVPLSFRPIRPVESLLYGAGYQLLCAAMDKIAQRCQQSAELAAQTAASAPGDPLRISVPAGGPHPSVPGGPPRLSAPGDRPSEELQGLAEDGRQSQEEDSLPPLNRRSTTTAPIPRGSSVVKKESVISGGKKGSIGGVPSGGGKGKPDPKKPQKRDTKSNSRGSIARQSKGSAVGKELMLRPREGQEAAPSSVIEASPGELAARARRLVKLHSQVYSLLGEMAEEMAGAFYDILGPGPADWPEDCTGGQEADCGQGDELPVGEEEEPCGEESPCGGEENVENPCTEEPRCEEEQPTEENLPCGENPPCEESPPCGEIPSCTCVVEQLVAADC